MDEKKDEAAWLIHSFAIAHGGVAFTLANTLVGDTVLLSGLTFYMVHKLGKLYGREDASAKQIISQSFAYYAGSYLTGKLLFWLPGIGNWANAATTVFITETIGWTCVTLFSSGKKPEELSKEEWKAVLDQANAKAKTYQEENKAILRKMSGEEKRKFRAINKKLRDPAVSEAEKENLLDSLETLYGAIKNR